MHTDDHTPDERILKRRYLKIFKILLLISFVYLLWAIFQVLSVSFFGYSNKWAYLTMDQWIITTIALFSIVLVISIVFLLHVRIVKSRRIEAEKPQPQFFKGRRLHIYTHPKYATGGVFSKTLIKLDDYSILSLRYQMIPPDQVSNQRQ